MRISDWSSDVCSSDLRAVVRDAGIEQLLGGCCVRQRYTQLARGGEREIQILLVQIDTEARIEAALDHTLAVDLKDTRTGEAAQIGRASCRERVCQSL